MKHFRKRKGFKRGYRARRIRRRGISRGGYLY